MKLNRFILLLTGIVSLTATSMFAANFQQATVTRAVNQVDVLLQNSSPKPATVGETVRGQTAVSTGAKSRAELTFPDNTLLRMGANTFFSFQQGTRNIDLSNGTILLQSPKSAGGATIRTAPVTAAITGTTLLFEYSPGSPGSIKLIVMEGEVRLSLTGRMGESVVVGPGQMISIPDNATSLPDPVAVDVERLMKSSRLINEGGGLPDTVEIDNVILAQQELKQRGVLLEVNHALQDQNNPGANPAANPAQTFTNIQSRTDSTSQPPQQPPVPQPTPPQPPPTPVPTPPIPKPTDYPYIGP